jgi:hypothetical protein
MSSRTLAITRSTGIGKLLPWNLAAKLLAAKLPKQKSDCSSIRYLPSDCLLTPPLSDETDRQQAA